MNDQQSIRPFLAALEEDDALLRIPKEVDPAFELSAFLSAADAGPALLFEKVKGSGLRVAGNLLNGRARIAAALGITPADIVPRIHEAIRSPVKPVQVANGRVQDVVVTDNPLSALPVPRFFEREARHYITAGVILARDPHTGKGNASFARFAIHDGKTAMVGIAPNQIVVALGTHPAIQLAACLYLGVGDDELDCAGSLLGSPVRVVPAKTVDLMVPADAEIVLEGEIDARQPLEEGFVSEYHGMYENYGPGFRATFSALTHAQDAIYQAIEPGYHREHVYLGALPIAASLRSAIAAVVPNVRDVAVTEAGAGRTDIVVQLEAPRPGQARRAMFAAFAAVSLVKRVTVVDADIDPWDPVAVDWARVNRMKLERDLLLVPHAGTDRSEAMEDGGLVTKAGFDATAKSGDRAEGIERALPPQAQRDAARTWLMDSLPSEKRRWLK
jgi:4-hydroxy-3-polyprenylbenzoate decarboxylase